MKAKPCILFILLVFCSQLVFLLFSNVIKVHFILNCLFQVLTIFFIGDFIGKFIFKLPLFNYSNPLTYLYDRIIGSIGFLFILCIVWGVLIAYHNFWGYKYAILEPIIKGGLIPTIYYMLVNMNYLSKSDRAKKLLKRKL